jgi:hypothetical protein
VCLELLFFWAFCWEVRLGTESVSKECVFRRGKMISREDFESTFINGGYSRTKSTLRKWRVYDADVEFFAIEGWALAWEFRDRLRNDTSLVPFASKSAINCWRDERRRCRRLEQLEPKHDRAAQTETSAPPCDPSELLDECSASERES